MSSIDDGHFDVAVIGAGVVGCAVAHVFAERGRRVAIVEREPREGTGITSRNSGVIHSGLYYPPGSRKATMCVRGNAMLYAWARRHDVQHRQTGKLVIASTRNELAPLQKLHANARASGAEGIRMIDGAEARAREPSLPNVEAALLCERSGIIDPHALTRSFLRAAERAGALWLPRTAVTACEPSAHGLTLTTTRGPLEADVVVNAAGLHADEVASMVGLDDYVLYPWRGDYFRLQTKTHYKHLIYPVRLPDAPGVGVHLVIDLAGGYRVGPDAELATSKHDFSPAEHKHAVFLEATTRLLGPIDPDQLSYDGCGLRPKLRGPDDAADRDFEIIEHPRGMLHLLGIESPGLTAALALAHQVAGQAEQDIRDA